ncbi:unnamed protein product [Leptosia nina]|uniref:Peptidase aspartic putative domain-containing protein n=1 Tax=Leptosia nina TaxID=320188 RepID=A0AAV1JQM1_9NEOP
MPVTRSQENLLSRKESDESSQSMSAERLTATTTATTMEEVTSHTRSTSSQREQAATKTLVPEGSTRLARSQRSSLTRRRELEAQEELARLELEQAEAAARLARIRLERLCEEDDDSIIEENVEERNNGHTSYTQRTAINCEDRKSDIGILADALKQAITHANPTPQPKYVYELPTFDGDSREWTAFRVVYEETQPMFSEMENIARLRKAIQGSARETLKCLLYSASTPTEIMEALSRRYGRPDALVLAELDKMRKLSRTGENPRDICTFASQICNSVAAIKALKKPRYLHSPELVKEIIDKMPSILRFRWYDFIAESEEDSLSSLTHVSEFLNKEADKCAAFATLEERKPIRRQQTHSAYNVVGNEGKIIPCPLCSGDHALSECCRFEEASVQERWDIVKQNRICFKCLKGKHNKEVCKKPPCKVCKRLHHPMLHVSKTEIAHSSSVKGTANNITNTATRARALLKIRRVEVYGPKGSTSILALMDEGSTLTLLDSSVAKELGLKGAEKQVCVETASGNHMINRRSIVMDLEIKGTRQTSKKILRGVSTMNNLKLAPQYLDKEKIQSYRHLRGMADTLYYEAEAPKMLIGQDNWQFIVTQQVRRGRPGQPVASRTKLGWVLHGANPNTELSIDQINTCIDISENCAVKEQLKSANEEIATEMTLSDLPRRMTAICTEGEPHVSFDINESSYSSTNIWRSSESGKTYKTNLAATKTAISALNSANKLRGTRQKKKVTDNTCNGKDKVVRSVHNSNTDVRREQSKRMAMQVPPSETRRHNTEPTAKRRKDTRRKFRFHHKGSSTEHEAACYHDQLRSSWCWCQKSRPGKEMVLRARGGECGRPP